jgi:hypothetical protein
VPSSLRDGRRSPTMDVSWVVGRGWVLGRIVASAREFGVRTANCKLAYWHWSQGVYSPILSPCFRFLVTIYIKRQTLFYKIVLTFSIPIGKTMWIWGNLKRGRGMWT